MLATAAKPQTTKPFTDYLNVTPSNRSRQPRHRHRLLAQWVVQDGILVCQWSTDLEISVQR